VTRPALVLLATAVLLAGADLLHKALTVDGATLLHERGPGYVLLAVVALVWAGALLAARSVLLAAGGGVLLGGAAGNLASLAFWPGVPNPLVAGGVAFTIADVAAAAGGLVLVPAAAALVAWRRRGRLGEAVALELR
jgi:hypothetical protein